MKIDFQKDLQDSRIPSPCPMHTMMVKISVETFSEEELRKKFNELTRKGDWNKECEECKNPQLLHKTICTRKV